MKIKIFILPPWLRRPQVPFLPPARPTSSLPRSFFRSVARSFARSVEVYTANVKAPWLFGGLRAARSLREKKGSAHLYRIHFIDSPCASKPMSEHQRSQTTPTATPAPNGSARTYDEYDEPKAKCEDRSRSPRGSSGARGSTDDGSLSISDIRNLTPAVKDMVKMRVQAAKAATTVTPTPSAAPGREPRLQKTTEPMVQVPASSLRLLASSLGQIRECVERRAAQAAMEQAAMERLTPVIVTAQAAMEQLANQGRNS